MSFSEQITAHSLVDAVYDENYDESLGQVRHSHFPLEIIYCTDGAIKLEYVNDKGLDDTAVLSARQFLLIRPRVLHILRIMQTTKLYVIELGHNGQDDILPYIVGSHFASDLPTLKKFFASLGAVTVLTDSTCVDRTLGELISLAYKKRCGDTDEFYFYEYDVTVKKLFIEICRAGINTEKAHGNKYVTAAMNYIYSNFDKALTLDGIADFVGITPRYLQELFKEAYENTVIAMLINYRIHKAKQLLTQTDNGISQIARQVGYTSLRAFLAAFTSHVGLSPSSYREKHRSDRFIRDFEGEPMAKNDRIESWIDNNATPPRETSDE